MDKGGLADGFNLLFSTRHDQHPINIEVPQRTLHQLKTLKTNHAMTAKAQATFRQRQTVSTEVRMSIESAGTLNRIPSHVGYFSSRLKFPTSNATLTISRVYRGRTKQNTARC